VAEEADAKAEAEEEDDEGQGSVTSQVKLDWLHFSFWLSLRPNC
jgi:hypothetical protein